MNPKSYILAAKSPCPECGAMLEAATSVLGTTGPTPGDMTICYKCRALLAFGENLVLRRCTDDELSQMNAVERGEIDFVRNIVDGVGRTKS